MPRIVVTADIHLGLTTFPEMQKLIADVRHENPDAVAIAGDIGEGVENIRIVLEEFARIGVPVGAVSGNHDVWNYDKKHPSEDLWGEILPEIAKSRGVTWLDNENLVVGKVAIVGSNAWYDYSAQDPVYRFPNEICWQRKREFDADAWQVDWPWNDLEFCRMIEPGFRNRLKSAQENPDVKSIIVVTHSPIFEEQIRRKPGNFKWGFSNAYYGNLTFGKIVRQFDKVTNVVSGHSHAGMEGVVEIKGKPVRVITLDSQYNCPVYVALESG